MHALRNWTRPKLALLLAAALLLSAFFLSWFMQTVWLSALNRDNSLSTAVGAYVQLACAIVAAVISMYAGVLLWKARGSRREL